MNFGTIGGFVARNGKSILTKTAVAAGLIAGMAFLTDKPEDVEDEELFVGDCEETEGEVIEATATDVTEVN